MFKRIKASGLLSFGPSGIDLEMRPLNVFIGPNGSGKSNFIEILALLNAAPKSLARPVKEMSGVKEWLWKGEGSSGVAAIDVVVDLGSPLNIRHYLSFTEHGERFELTGERIEDGEFAYTYINGKATLYDGQERRFNELRPEESVLSQIRDPERYPVLAKTFRAFFKSSAMFTHWPNLEAVPKDRILVGAKRISGGKYAKGPVSADVLEKTSFAKVAGQCPSAGQLLDRLRKL